MAPANHLLQCNNLERGGKLSRNFNTMNSFFNVLRIWTSCLVCVAVCWLFVRPSQVFAKSGAEQQLLQRAVDLKRSLVAALQKHRELEIDYKTRKRRVVSVSLLFISSPLCCCRPPPNISVAWLFLAARLDSHSVCAVLRAEERLSSKSSACIFYITIDHMLACDLLQNILAQYHIWPPDGNR